MEFPDHPFAAYWYALGKFVHRYAEIEATMHQVLRIVSNSTDRTAKVLFSGTRISSATDMVKRFYTARGADIPSSLAKAFGHIGTITKARDRLLHNSIQFERGKAIVTDETKNFTPRSFKHAVSIRDLDDLEADAITANACLVSFWIESRRPDLLTSAGYLCTKQASQAAWRYKSPQPMKTRETIRGTAQERKAQPRS